MTETTRMHPPGMQGAAPSVVAWESTRACSYACVHCRAEAQKAPDPKQLTTEEALNLVDQIAELCKPIFIISGGDPLLRGDIFRVAEYASSKGFRVIMSPSGSNMTPEIIEKMRASGVRRISVSIDGSTPEVHDNFRQVSGAFNRVLRSTESARRGGLSFQINTTVTQHNLADLPNIHKLAVKLGADAWDVFMLVPTGRGKVKMEVAPQQYEATLNLIYELNLTSPIPIKMTCAPHYVRVIAQRGESCQVNDLRPNDLSRRPSGGRGCMAGNGFCFISHTGEVFGCGFLPVSAGSVRHQRFNEIYQRSALFTELRSHDLLGGKCGRCEYRHVCGGCRARALMLRGSYMEEEPYCLYEPEGFAAVKF